MMNRTVLYGMTVWIALVLTISTGYPATYYVDVENTAANDANPGTQALPWRSIRQAAQTLNAGDIVFIRKGSYFEDVATLRSGNEIEGFIVFSAYPGEKPVIKGSSMTTGNNGFIISHSYIRLIGLELSNWKVNAIWIDNAAYVQISDCDIHDVTYGIGIANGSHDFEINRVTVHDFIGYGFDASPVGTADCYNGTFNDCIAHTAKTQDQNADGFSLGHGDQHNFIFNRCIAYKVFDGFDISARNTTLNRCTAYSCTNSGYKFWEENITLLNSIGYQHGNSVVEIDWDGKPASVTLRNCTFMDAGNYMVWVENPADVLYMYNCILAVGKNIGLALEQQNIVNYHGNHNIFQMETPESRAVSAGYIDEFLPAQVAAGEWATHSGEDTRSIVVNSSLDIFFNPAAFDFHLKGLSPAIDKGMNFGSPNEDFDGDTRPQGNGVDIGADESHSSTSISGMLAADFGDFGLYLYDGSSWIWIAANSEDMTAWKKSLAVDFGNYGLYLYDGTIWTRIADNPENIIVWENFIAGDFGSSGLSIYDGSTWKKIAGNAKTIAAWGKKLAASFGEHGLFLYDGSDWKWISGSVENIAGWGDYLAADFGDFGLHLYDGKTWKKIASNPENIVNWGKYLACDFGDAGLYIYDGSSWKYAAGNPENIGTWGDFLTGDFGEFGLYIYDERVWNRIGGNPEDMTALNSD